LIKNYFGLKKGNDENVLISTVLINWNRCHLLKKTIESYLDTVSVPFELLIVDNGSTDDSRDFIENICHQHPQIKGILLTQNVGGEALNLGLEQAKGTYFHISENDLEYLPEWDTELLTKFKTFPKLGQLSLFSPEFQSEKGEIWTNHPAEPIIEKEHKIFLTKKNVGTSCIIRREIWDKGVRWKNVINPEHLEVKLPDDGDFSNLVKNLGYWVAWNNKYTVINWGHNVNEWIKHLDYYLTNYKSKKQVGLKGMKKKTKRKWL